MRMTYGGNECCEGGAYEVVTERARPVSGFANEQKVYVTCSAHLQDALANQVQYMHRIDIFEIDSVTIRLSRATSLVKETMRDAARERAKVSPDAIRLI